MFVHIVDAFHAGLDVSNESSDPRSKAGLNVAIRTEAPPGRRDGGLLVSLLVSKRYLTKTQITSDH